MGASKWPTAIALGLAWTWASVAEEAPAAAGVDWQHGRCLGGNQPSAKCSSCATCWYCGKKGRHGKRPENSATCAVCAAQAAALEQKANR